MNSIDNVRTHTVTQITKYHKSLTGYITEGVKYNCIVIDMCPQAPQVKLFLHAVILFIH